MAYMVAGYLVIWLVSFVMIFSLVQRQRTLQREIQALREMSDERGGAEQPATARQAEFPAGASDSGQSGAEVQFR